MMSLNEHTVSLLRIWILVSCPLFLPAVTGQLSFYHLAASGRGQMGKEKFILSVLSLYYMLVDNPLTGNSIPCGLPTAGGRIRRG